MRVEALLDNYWQSRPSQAVKDEILADWMDALENYTPDEIRMACREYLRGDDRARKPKPGDIREIIINHRAANMPRRVEVPQERERVSREAAAEIMAKAGFVSRRFGNE